MIILNTLHEAMDEHLESWDDWIPPRDKEWINALIKLIGKERLNGLEYYLKEKQDED